MSESGFVGLGGFSGFRFARIAIFAIDGNPDNLIWASACSAKDARREESSNPANPDSGKARAPQAHQWLVGVFGDWRAVRKIAPCGAGALILAFSPQGLAGAWSPRNRVWGLGKRTAFRSILGQRKNREAARVRPCAPRLNLIGSNLNGVLIGMSPEGKAAGGG